MEQDSLLRRSLVWMGTLLGISITWIGLVSVISVLLADRLVLSLGAGRSPSAADSSTSPTRKPADFSSTSERPAPRVDKPIISPKPNG
jgi:hypothetical protein